MNPEAGWRKPDTDGAGGMPDATRSDGAQKHDAGKLRYDLVPAGAFEEIVRVYTEGSVIYADRNWEQGMRWSRCFAAMMRHAWSWWRGNARHDRGMHHLASVAWYCLALMHYEAHQRGIDDRPTYDTPLKAEATNA